MGSGVLAVPKQPLTKPLSEAPDATGRSDDQHLLPGLHLAGITNRLQCGEGRDRHRCGLVEREVVRLGRNLVGLGTGVLGEGALGDAEHRVAGMHRCHCRADRFHTTSDFTTAHTILRYTEPVPRKADRVSQPGHEVPDPTINTGRMDLHQHLVVADRGPLDVLETQHVTTKGLYRTPDNREL